MPDIMEHPRNGIAGGDMMTIEFCHAPLIPYLPQVYLGVKNTCLIVTTVVTGERNGTSSEREELDERVARIERAIEIILSRVKWKWEVGYAPGLIGAKLYGWAELTSKESWKWNILGTGGISLVDGTSSEREGPAGGRVNA